MLVLGMVILQSSKKNLNSLSAATWPKRWVPHQLPAPKEESKADDELVWS